MMNFFTKFVFLLKRPKVIIVAGNHKDSACAAIFEVLRKDFKVEKVSKFSGQNIWQNEILIFSTQDKNISIFDFFIKKSKMPILLVTAFGEIPNDKIFFAGNKEKVKPIIELTKKLSKYGKLIFCFDDETVREIQECANCDCLSFGLGQKANCYASDIRIDKKADQGANFKINYKGNIVPVWLSPKKSSKQDIYNSLSAACCGIVLNMNLVEISQILKTGTKHSMR